MNWCFFFLDFSPSDFDLPLYLGSLFKKDPRAESETVGIPEVDEE